MHSFNCIPLLNNHQAKDLFQLQTELVDRKVDMAVSNAIDRVLEQIGSLKHEIHELRHEMHQGFAALDKRVVAIETRLGMVNETQKEIRNKFIDYSFKAGWLILGAFLMRLFSYLQ